MYLPELGELFSDQSKDTWQRLSFVKDSLQTRGVLGSMRFGEETITDLMLMDLFVKGSSVILFEQTPKHVEALSGTDFELWLGTDQLGWFRFAIQAKKLDLRTERYISLTQRNSNGRQIDLLEQFADDKHAAPLYCLFNFTANANFSEHWHCCNAYPNRYSLNELGCSVTPSSTIRKAILNHGAKNFRFIHKMPNALPWSCLVSCPKVHHSMALMSAKTLNNGMYDTSPLFDPISCYHRTFPGPFRRYGGRTRLIRQNNAGGSLLSLEPETYHEVSEEIDRIERPSLVDLSRQVRRNRGTPKAIAVLDLEQYRP